jgi:CheY-like chemotaxis protein
VPDPDTAPGQVVLLVEDEAPNRALIRAVFARAGEPQVREARLIEADDLATARDVLAQAAVDLVLLDVRLPDGNGLDLARELRDAGTTRPAVIVLSASVLPTERDKAIDSGADHFVSKPFVPTDLTALIASQLASREAARD